MQVANNQQPLNDDGTPRRKYELDEPENGKYILRATIGLVFANAFILVKNMLFGNDPAPKPQIASMTAIRDNVSTAGDEREAAVADGGKTNRDEEEDSEADQRDGDAPNGFVKLLYTSSGSAPMLADQSSAAAVRFTSALAKHGNDNVALYGALPGKPIALFSIDGSHDSFVLRAANSGGGGDTGGGSGSHPGSSGDTGETGDTGGTGGTGSGGDTVSPSRTNRLPMVGGPVILASLLSNQSVVIALSELLRNASDPDGDQLSVRNLTSSSGSLQVRRDGNWTFTPDPDDTSNVTFSYSVSDGVGATAQSAVLDLIPAVRPHIVGTDGDDTIIGTPGADVIDALNGHDVILGREGDDTIFGGDGNDRIVAGDGNDVVYAGAGDDVVFGGAGNDVIFGGTGNDLLFGDDGDDVLVGEEGNDTIWGGAGNDILVGGAGDDALYGDGGDDFLDGGSGHNYLDGGAGNDTLIVHAGDTAMGGAGNDTFHLVPKPQSVAPQAIDDVHNTSSTAPAPTAAQPVVVEQPTDDAPTHHVDLSTDETFVVPAATESSTAEVLPVAKTVASVLAAAEVAPTPDVSSDNEPAVVTKIDGGPDEDTIDASAISAPLTVNLDVGSATSADTGFIEIVNIENVIGGSGPNTLVGSDVANKLTGGENHDVILGKAGDDQIHGGKGDDILAGDKGADIVHGDDGDDVIAATKDDGDDSYDGGTGHDTYNASMTSANLTVDLEQGTASSTETGHDTVVNIENVVAGDGDNKIVGNSAANEITGGANHDEVHGRDGNDEIRGAGGDDLLAGDKGADIVHGDDGDDIIVATKDDGCDTYDGGDGTDTYDASMTAADVTIDLAQGTASSTETGHDQLASIENACGGSGNDTLIASQEVNALTGGDGADTFVFGSVAAIGRGEGHRDRILDFAVGDRIDLDKISDEFIDDLQAFGDQVIRRFVLIGEQEAFTKPGQLRVKYQELDDHQITILEGNINCDADAEFELELLGFNNLQDENFIQHQ